jgi:hypothetical protein
VNDTAPPRTDPAVALAMPVTDSVSPSGSESLARIAEVTSVGVSSSTLTASSTAAGGSLVPLTVIVMLAVRVCLSLATS